MQERVTGGHPRPHRMCYRRVARVRLLLHLLLASITPLRVSVWIAATRRGTDPGRARVTRVRVSVWIAAAPRGTEPGRARGTRVKEAGVTTKITAVTVRDRREIVDMAVVGAAVGSGAVSALRWRWDRLHTSAVNSSNSNRPRGVIVQTELLEQELVRAERAAASGVKAGGLAWCVQYLCCVCLVRVSEEIFKFYNIVYDDSTADWASTRHATAAQVSLGRLSL